MDRRNVIVTSIGVNSCSTTVRTADDDDDGDECLHDVRLAIITTGAGDLLRQEELRSRVIGHLPVFEPAILHSADINNAVIAKYDERFAAQPHPVHAPGSAFAECASDIRNSCREVRGNTHRSTTGCNSHYTSTNVH